MLGDAVAATHALAQLRSQLTGSGAKASDRTRWKWIEPSTQSP